jgi:hypothetical protein
MGLREEKYLLAVGGGNRKKRNHLKHLGFKVG